MFLYTCNALDEVFNLYTFKNFNFINFTYNHETRYHKSKVNSEDFTLQHLINPEASVTKFTTRDPL